MILKSADEQQKMEDTFANCIDQPVVFTIML